MIKPYFVTPSRPVIYLIVGKTASGKTWCGKKIARKLNAVHFALDDRLKPLTFPQFRDPFFEQDLLSKANNCVQQILRESESVIAGGRDVVLDIATFQRAQRDWIRSWAEGIGHSVVVYHVIADLGVRRRRLSARNAEKGENYAFEVPDWLFHLVEAAFEEPGAEENAIVITNDEDL